MTTTIKVAFVAALVAGCGTGSTEEAAVGPDAEAGGGLRPDAGAGEDAECESGGGAANGVDYESQIQPIFDTRCTGCHGDSGGLELSSYQSAVAGGASGPGVEPCDCENSVIWQKISPNPPFGDRMPQGGPYLNETEQQLICAWINEGAGETYDPAACGAAEPPPPSEECTGECGDGTCDTDEDCASCPGDCGVCNSTDTTPPEFEGLLSADELSETTCAVQFRPATDDVSVSSALVYDIFAGPRDAVDLSEPITTLESSDLTTEEDEVVGTVTLSSGQRYDLIVRARDEAGNSDDNTEAHGCDLR